MAHQFSQVPQAQIPRSSFNRSHSLKTTFDAGWLIPIFVDEALPGDTFNLRANLFGRLATPIAPLMDNLFMETFFFFVPNRLVWENWQKFNGEQDNPGDSTDYTIPSINGSSANITNGSIYDYMGLPPASGGTGYYPNHSTVSALPFRAYGLIWNEWFRDQNLQDSVNVDISDSPMDSGTPVLLRRGKRHDYFTSALPFPQKGETPNVPLAGLAPVQGLGWEDNQTVTGAVGTQNIRETAGITSAPYAVDVKSATYPLTYATDTVGGSTTSLPQIYADLSEASGFTINDLRQSFQIQKLLERDARGGTRYTEIVRSHFGVTSPDARLQRPEFLGGGSSMISINPVASTAQVSGAAGPPSIQDKESVGGLGAFGTVSAQGHGFTKSFTEHGHIIGLVNVRADLTYQQGINRMWTREGRYDFYWPALAHIGEQAVRQDEIYAVDSVASNTATFGYQERYAEYRYKPSLITARFRSSAGASLDYWHLSQDFGSAPVLGDTFIQDNPPIDRVVNVPAEPDFLLDIFFNLRCARPMPLYGVPGLIDHF